MKIENYRRAAEHLAIVAALCPDFEDGHFEYIRSVRALKQTSRTIDLLSQHTDKWPTSYRAFHLLGTLLDKQRRYTAAIAAYEKALADPKRRAKVSKQLGEAKVKLLAIQKKIL